VPVGLAPPQAIGYQPIKGTPAAIPPLGEYGMVESYPSNLEPWSTPGVAVQDIFGLTDEELAVVAPPPLRGPHHPHEFAQKLYAFEALQPSVTAAAPAIEPEPYSLQWFLDIENQRHSRHARWIPKLLEFAKHSGETLLGLGHGLGTDWAQYARHGASVIVCSGSNSQLELVRRNFALRGLNGRFVHAVPTQLPLETCSVDVACLSSLHHGIDHPEAVVQEVYRVLKPGGKVLAVTPARYDINFWVRRCFFWSRWMGRWMGRQKRRPPINPSHRSTARELCRLFGRFTEHRVRKRQLRRSEVPHVWRWMPLAVMARLMGRVLVLKAFKPLSAALAEPSWVGAVRERAA
jgi:SAM-dependent methyltransferase